MNSSAALALLGRYESITLDKLDSVALQNRTDTKYLLSTRQLAHALAALSDHYQILDISGTRASAYQTLYFDTADFALYLRHHDRRRDRYKVRSRRYVETDRAFLEIKHKTNKRRTVKQRVETDHLLTQLAESSDDMPAHIPVDGPLEPKLWNEFSRITLVSKRHHERVTLDLGLRFGNDQRALALPGIVVAEVKQDDINRSSDFIQFMRAAQIHAGGFSKYCIGVSLLYDSVKHNNFKPKLQQIDKLLRGTHHG